MKDVERAKLCTSATGRCWEEQRKRFFKCISFFCALISHPGSSLGSETLPLVSWEQAQSFNDGRHSWLSGPFVSQGYQLSLRRHIITQTCTR